VNVHIIQILRTTASISGSNHNASFLLDSGTTVSQVSTLLYLSLVLITLPYVKVHYLGK